MQAMLAETVFLQYGNLSSVTIRLHTQPWLRSARGLIFFGVEIVHLVFNTTVYLTVACKVWLAAGWTWSLFLTLCRV